MKQLLDFLPLILFFIVYKFEPQTVMLGTYPLEIGGIFSATMVLIVTSVIVYGGLYIKQRYLEKRDLITLIAVLFFGGLTLTFHNETFLKWKAPVVNWIFAIVLLGSQFIGEKPLLQRMMGHILTLPRAAWLKVNVSWVIFFAGLGLANLWVAFTYEAIWVDFKIFGSMGLTFLFVVIQMILLVNYQKHLYGNSNPASKTDQFNISNDQKFNKNHDQS